MNKNLLMTMLMMGAMTAGKSNMVIPEDELSEEEKEKLKAEREKNKDKYKWLREQNTMANDKLKQIEEARRKNGLPPLEFGQTSKEKETK